MEKFTAYIGTYSQGKNGGIFHVEFCGGEIKVLDTCDVENPSFLAYSRDKKSIFAVSETAVYDGKNGGSAVSLRINGDGSLVKTAQLATMGKDPCFVRQDCEDKVWAANYSEGTATVFRTCAGKLIEIERIIAHQGRGVNLQRQEMAHIHCTELTPDGNIAVCDLGLDSVTIYSVHGEKLCETKFPDDSGPRHIAFADDRAYVVTELSCELFDCSYCGGILTLLESHKLLTNDYDSENTAAAVKISPDGKNVAVSIRGHDSISIFRINESGETEFLQNLSSEGSFPRDLAYTPDGRWLLAANQLGDSISVFEVSENGKLSYSGKSFAFPKPVMILFS